MTQLVLDSISPAVFQEIARRARKAGTSVQVEASRLLEEAVARPPPSRDKGARQAALAAQHPEEYVVLRGDQVLMHTSDEEQAFACYEDALDHPDEDEPLIVPPGALRKLPRPVVRGRALARSRRS